jgi:hypothetical protein
VNGNKPEDLTRQEEEEEEEDDDDDDDDDEGWGGTESTWYAGPIVPSPDDR